MQSIRKMENLAATLYRERLIRGFCHLSIGQEAVCVGVKAALNPNDSLITGYRCHGWSYVMGISMNGILAELTGRKSGCGKGKGGSMHMYTKSYYGGNGIVASQIPIGAGIALKYKYFKEKNVCYALYGDGAANQGQVFETFNMAKLWNLPIVFVCENNGYAMGTSVSRGSASTDFYTRGDFIPGIRLDGMDVLGVKEATKFSREFVLKNGPILLEMLTYRYSGHSMSDPDTTYRKREEIQDVRKNKDPIKTFCNDLIESNLITQNEFDEIDRKIDSELNEAKGHALYDPELNVEEMYNHVYKDVEPGFKIRGCDNFNYNYF